MVDVQGIDEQTGRAQFFRDEPHTVLVLVLDESVVDHREVQARRGIVMTWVLLCLLVNAAAIEYGEQVRKLPVRYDCTTT